MKLRFISIASSIILLLSTAITHSEDLTDDQQRPDTYEIQAGDTLWDLCARFLGDPHAWPQLWSVNQEIKNPHQIYPGQYIQFWSGSEQHPSRIALVDEPQQIARKPKKKKAITQVRSGLPVIETDESKKSIRIRERAFLSMRKPQSLGYIKGSAVERDYFNGGDTIYLVLKDPTQHRPGDRFTVFDTQRSIYHPDTGKYMGKLVVNLGTVRVVNKKGKVAEAILEHTIMAVSRKAKLMKYVPSFHEVTQRQHEQRSDGFIIDLLNDELNETTITDMVFLDKGKQDNITAGTIFHVMRQRDSLQRKGPILTEQIAGRLLIVNAYDNYSTAYVLDAKRALVRGDIVSTGKP